MQQTRDQMLIEKAVKGDREAFSALLEQYYDFIYRVAYKWTGNQSDAEDVTQTVCIKIASALKSYKGKADFSSWLYRVTLNSVHDLHRKQQSYKNTGQQLAFVTPDHVSPADLSDTTLDDLWNNVRKLPEKQRDAVMLVYSEELSHKQAAEVMGCAEKTVSWHIHKARETLKKLMSTDVD